MSSPLAGYLAPEGFERELEVELSGVTERYGRLMIAPAGQAPAWAQNVWLDLRRERVASIGDAAKKLKGIQRNWALYSYAEHRRAALIEEKLPPVKAAPIAAYAELPTAPLGSWTLLDRDTLLYSARCSSPFVHGEPRFIEDKEGPPSRAYLKLWELFTLLGVRPASGERVIDLGSAPGGWTWVLAQLGCDVTSVDKAEVDPRVAALPGVRVVSESAFGLRPFEVDWLFSDVICYPARLLNLVERWMSAGAARRFVCTLKFQGETDHETARRFAQVPGSRLLHLAHNRHELTWVKL